MERWDFKGFNLIGYFFGYPVMLVKIVGIVRSLGKPKHSQRLRPSQPSKRPFVNMKIPPIKHDSIFPEPIIPVFQYSNIPIGAQPLSSIGRK